MTHVIQTAPTATPTATNFPPLEQITRPGVTTEEIAHYTNTKPQTWRIKACKETFPEGLRPIRVCGRLNWPTAGLKKLLGLQAGFADALMLAAIAGLAMLAQAFAPSLFDLTGIAMLGAGVIGGRDTMSRTYFNLTELAAAATAQDYTVHLHLDDQNKPVFSVGNSNTGAHEFQSVSDAMAYLNMSTKDYDAARCAEQAGHAIGANCLDAILAGRSQAESVTVLQAALVDLQALDHQDRATAGFAVALVAVIEKGLDHA